MAKRKYSLFDQLLINIDTTVKVLLGQPAADKINPAAEAPELPLTLAQRRVSAGLMRVNHTGEICAQALYQGQALTARQQQTQQAMSQAAQEEINHLAWCKDRLKELSSHTSYLNPIWYVGSLTLGIAAGIWGDKWSLGFLAETEQQVARHLQSHLNKLPAQDKKSRKIVEQMYYDEVGHEQMAVRYGAADLPAPVKIFMKYSAKIMTTVAYWV